MSMSSFIYFYSKFTEDFLLIGAAAIFTLLSLYCYHWVVRKRLLGAARNQIPAGMVRIYLNQLINEAQSVRTQLFGLVANGEAAGESMAKFQMPTAGSSHGAAPSHAAPASGGSGENTEISKDLLERLQALEKQLSQKESMVVNVNIEKMKLLEEIETLKNQKAAPAPKAGASGDQTDLLKKIKSLEERLDEYALFEDDLANLKRLQQENAQLKKRLEEAPAQSAAPALAAVPNPAPAKPEPKEPYIEPASTVPTPAALHPVEETMVPAIEAKKEKLGMLDADAIDQLLNGVTPEPKAPDPTPAAPPKDDFEKLVDSVETSLDQPVSVAPPAAAGAPAPVAAAPAAAPKEESLNSKTDEELLKEFETLLNS